MYFYDDSIPAPDWTCSKADRGSLDRMKFITWEDTIIEIEKAPQEAQLPNRVQSKKISKGGLTMDCSTCANNWPNNMCRSMARKPKIKWCHMSTEEAISAEKAVISYIEYQEEKMEIEEELKNLRMAKTKAYSRIRELEGLK